MTPSGEVEAWSRQQIARGECVGVQVYGSRSDGRFVSCADGLARPGVNLQSSTQVPWMCAGKPFVAAAVLRLAGRGLVDLEALIPFGPAGAGQTASLASILEQSTGLHFAEPVVEPALQDAAAAEELLRGVTREPAWSVERRGYSPGLAWLLLGIQLERQLGSSVPDIVRREVLVPLGLHSSHVGTPSPTLAVERTACLYAMNERRAIPCEFMLRPGYAAQWSPAGSGWGPMRDMARLYEAALDGANDQDINGALQNLVSLRSNAIDEYFDAPVFYGLGAMVDMRWRFGNAVSDTSFGYTGAGAVCAVADPKTSLVFCAYVSGEWSASSINDANGRFGGLLAAVKRDLQLS